MGLREGLLFTKEEACLLDAINCDNSSGRHLLSPRSEEYWAMRKVVHDAYEASDAGNATDRQLQIIEYLHQGEDYFYWKKLPDDKKLFFEEESEYEQ